MRKASHCGSKQQWSSITIIACSRHTYLWRCSSRTSRSWWITQSTQHHRRGCNNIPSFLQWTAPIARPLCEGWTPHDLHILVTAPFCYDRKSRAAYSQSFALWQQATIEFTCHDHSIIACSRHIYVWCCSSRTSRSFWITQSTQHHRRGCNSRPTFFNTIHLLPKDKYFLQCNCFTFEHGTEKLLLRPGHEWPCIRSRLRQDSVFFFRTRSQKFVKNRTRIWNHFPISAVAGVYAVIS